MIERVSEYGAIALRRDPGGDELLGPVERSEEPT